MNPFDFTPTFLLPIVNERFYSVPQYQRSYAWTLEMVQDFWTDMERAIADEREHFLGNIVISAESDDGTLSIVDGQQRIVTTTILLAAIRDEFSESGEAKTAAAMGRYVGEHDVTTLVDRARVRMNPDDNPFYEQRIVNSASVIPTLESHVFMNDAYGFFRQQLSIIKTGSPSDWKARFARLSNFLNKQARIVLVTAPTDADAFTIFETLNDRGADLTISDLLKNLLFARATKTELEVVKQRWVETRAIIDDLKPRTDMMTFLRHFWSSRHGATRERDLYKEIKKAVTSKEQALKFTEELREDASTYRAILTPSDDDWKDFAASAKVALVSFDRMNLEQIRPLLLAVYRYFSAKEKESAAKSVLNWSVRGIVAGVFGGGKAETYFCNAAIKIRKGHIKTVAELLAEMKDFIPNDAGFQDAFERYRTTSNSFARYLLVGLERKMLGEAEPELVPNENVDEVNLEHVLPQRAKPSDWQQFTQDTIPIFAYRIGNMTLLRKGPNGKIGNKPFSLKQPVLSASGYKLNEIFKSKPDWSSNDIEARQSALGKLVAGVWPL